MPLWHCPLLSLGFHKAHPWHIQLASGLLKCDWPVGSSKIKADDILCTSNVGNTTGNVTLSASWGGCPRAVPVTIHYGRVTAVCGCGWEPRSSVRSLGGELMRSPSHFECLWCTWFSWVTDREGQRVKSPAFCTGKVRWLRTWSHIRKCSAGSAAWSGGFLVIYSFIYLYYFFLFSHI